MLLVVGLVTSVVVVVLVKLGVAKMAGGVVQGAFPPPLRHHHPFALQVVQAPARWRAHEWLLQAAYLWLLQAACEQVHRYKKWCLQVLEGPLGVGGAACTAAQGPSIVPPVLGTLWMIQGGTEVGSG